MDQYLSTYRKDFIWPYVRTFSIRTSPSYSERALQAKQPYRRVPCTCGAEPGGLMPPKEYVGPLDAEAHQWSRLGPMAPLLDPKLYPAKMGPAPEFEITRYDQPNTYLKKLHEKYPYLYNVLQSAPPDDMIRRVDEDRLRTTYQVDYSHIDEHPSADYDKLFGKAGISDWTNKVPCSREAPAVLDCRANIRPPDYSGQDQAGSLEKYARNGPDAFANRAGGFDDYREVANRGGGFGNDTGGFGGYREATNDRGGFRNDAEGFGDFRETTNDRGGFRNDAGRYGDFREATNDRGGFRNDAEGFGDFRETTNDRGGFRNDAGRYGEFREATNDRGGFRYDTGGFGDSREATNDRGGFRNDAGRYGDFREAANDRGGFRYNTGGYGDSRETPNGRGVFKDDSGRGPREYRDSREIANRGDGFKGESGRDAREYGNSREVTNRGGDYKAESGRDAREIGAKAMKSGNEGGSGGGGSGGGGSGGGGSGGKTTESGGFGSPDGDEGKSKRSGKVIDDEDAAKKPLPAWRSEYQEVIGQTGYDIIRDKMHQHGARSRGRSFIERIIMRCRA